MSRIEKIQGFDPNALGLQNGNFIGLPFEEEEAQIVLLPVPWDVTVSYAEGTASGPQNMLQASTQLDLYDPYFPEAWKHGLYMRHPDTSWMKRNEELRPKAKRYIDFLEQGGAVKEELEMEKVLEEINQASISLRDWVKRSCKVLLEKGKKVGLVGGEHSVPLGYLQALAERYPNFGILQFDAHLDLRKAYEGFTFSHASIFYNALQLPQVSKLVAVGIRDYCHEEVERVAQEAGRVEVYYDHLIKEEGFKGKSWHLICEEVIAHLPQQVYISFDIDGLLPALCPHTGTPVPGGLSFEQAIYLLHRLVASGREIIGFDLCEVAGLGHEWDGNVGARMLYRLANFMGISQNDRMSE